jgi:hypothetical protein
MRTVFIAPLVAALALSATHALADDSISSDGITYPGAQDVIFATGVDPSPIVAPDVTYRGPHATVVKNYLPNPDFASLATSEDVLYPAYEPLPAQAVPARPSAPASRVAQHDCGCPHHDAGCPHRG